ncbi:protein C19orf12 homolog [Diabrotica virgifera virgifera]|uniref:Protein C19orf12 homolog n=1 Tax=Diabrotica virgifera virgifera TaxID=50390 RepID=A0A6P7GSM9_DIAVI|nr:protein C19orf12 homolog [Diabrotica virgifera virgifera]
MAGIFNDREIVEMCHVLAEQEQLKVTVQESIKAGLLAGFGALAGALLGGPIGIAIGGTLGSATAAVCAKNKFRSVADIIRNDLSPRQQAILISNMSAVLSRIKPQDCVALLTLVLSTGSVKELVIKELGVFLLKELNLSMVQ